MSRHRLEEHRTRIRRILAMFPSGNNPNGAGIERIRTAFKALRDAVRTDVAQRDDGPDAGYSGDTMRRLLANLQRLNARTEPGPRWTLPLKVADTDVGQALAHWPRTTSLTVTEVAAVTSDSMAMHDLLLMFPRTPGLRDQLNGPFGGRSYDRASNRMMWLTSNGTKAVAVIATGLTQDQCAVVCDVVDRQIADTEGANFSSQLVEQAVAGMLRQQRSFTNA